MSHSSTNLLFRVLIAVSVSAGILVFLILRGYGAGAATAFVWSAVLFVGLVSGAILAHRWVFEPLVDRLQENEARYRTILNTTVDGIITIDASGTVLSVNPAVEEVFGYRMEEMVGQKVTMLMGEPDRSAHKGYLDHYLKTGEAKVIGMGREVVAVKKDGTPIPVELAVSEFQLEGRRMFTGVLRDLSERKRLEEQLTRSSKLAALGELVGGIAHEVNTPTGIIVMRSSGLARSTDPLSEEARDDIEVIQRQAHRIAQITSGLLAFSRQAPFAPHPSHPNPVVSKSVALIENMLRSRGIELASDLSEDVPVVLMDSSRIEQVLLNLFNNAMDAMPDGGTLRVATAREEGGWVRTSVEDTGVGIPEAYLDRLFDPFFTTKEVGKGTGLGLSISYGLIQEHGGRMEVESREGEGSVFHIYLPEHKGGEGKRELTDV